MKKFLAITLIIGLLIVSYPFTAFADTSGYYTYYISDGQAILYECDKTISGDIKIPETLGGYPVTTISPGFFAGCTNLTSVVIPSGVTRIGEATFQGCVLLQSVTIPDTVTSIGDAAFLGCSSLTSITIPNSVTSVGSVAFLNCTSLVSVTLSSGMTSINGATFQNCVLLQEITIPDSITYVDYGAFDLCDSLITVNYTGSESERQSMQIMSQNDILNDADWNYNFSSGCKEHTYDNSCDATCNVCGEVRQNISHTFDSASDIVCKNCGYHRYLTYKISDSGAIITGCDASVSGNVVLPSKYDNRAVVGIDNNAFNSCGQITSITLPQSVTFIGNSAFSNCTLLNSINFSTRLESIGDNAFENSGLLKSVCIPDTVTYVGNNAFLNCRSLTSVTVSRKIKSIESGTFSGCTSLERLVISNSVINVSESAFSGCSSPCDIYYLGTQQQAKNIVVADNNQSFTSGNWHYLKTGDLNGDGKTDIIDLVKLKKHLAKEGREALIFPDLDNDGDVVAKDLTILINLILTNI